MNNNGLPQQGGHLTEAEIQAILFGDSVQAANFTNHPLQSLSTSSIYPAKGQGGPFHPAYPYPLHTQNTQGSSGLVPPLTGSSAVQSSNSAIPPSQHQTVHGHPLGQHQALTRGRKQDGPPTITAPAAHQVQRFPSASRTSPEVNKLRPLAARPGAQTSPVQPAILPVYRRGKESPGTNETMAPVQNQSPSKNPAGKEGVTLQRCRHSYEGGTWDPSLRLFHCHGCGAAIPVPAKQNSNNQ